MKFSLRLLTTYLVGFSQFTQATGSTSPDSDPNVLVEALKGGSAAGVEEFKFETEVNKVMDIIIHSLYKTKGTMNHWVVHSWHKAIKTSTTSMPV